MQDRAPRATAQPVNTARDTAQRRGRVIFMLDRFMFTGQTFDHLLPAIEQDTIDPWIYAEVVGDVDADSWRIAIDS